LYVLINFQLNSIYSVVKKRYVFLLIRIEYRIIIIVVSDTALLSC